MVGPILLPVVLAVAGGLVEGWAGAVVMGGVGILIDLAVVAGAALWMRQIGSLLEPDEIAEHAPRPPGFGGLVDRVYQRVGGRPESEGSPPTRP